MRQPFPACTSSSSFDVTTHRRTPGQAEPAWRCQRLPALLQSGWKVSHQLAAEVALQEAVAAEGRGGSALSLSRMLGMLQEACVPLSPPSGSCPPPLPSPLSPFSTLPSADHPSAPPSAIRQMIVNTATPGKVGRCSSREVPHILADCCCAHACAPAMHASH